MRTSTTHDGLFAVVRLAGRLDSEAARYLSDTVEEALRDGARNIELDLAEVEYLSTPALRSIQRFLESLRALRGHLYLVSSPAPIRAILEAAGLGEACSAPSGMARASSPSGRFSRWGLPSVDARFGTYEVSHYSDEGVSCQLYGTAAGPATRIDPGSCRLVEFPERSFGLGIGALDASVEAAAPRLGEFVAAEGIASLLPSDGGLVPDFMLSYPGRPPAVFVGRGIAWRGLFSDLMRYSTQAVASAIPLEELAEVCVEMLGGDVVALATVAETSALVGARLRRSPAQLEFTTQAEPDAEALRGILSFTPEPAHTGCTALILGVAARRPPAPLAPFLRPLGKRGGIQGHFHAVAFPYTPVPQRTVMLPELLQRIFEESAPKDVLHLIHDDRGNSESGQTGLRRGVCWMTRITGTEIVA